MNARISIAGRDDRSVLDQVREQAAAARPPGRPPGAEALAAARDEEEYQEILLRILREHSAVDTDDMEIPYKPGVIGTVMRRVRGVLWKLLRYQHDVITARHNTIHALHAAALEYEHSRYQRRIEALEERITELERNPGASAPPTAGP